MSRAGRKAFDRCQVKVVQYTDSAVGSRHDIISYGGVLGLRDGALKVREGTQPAGAPTYYAGSSAKLHCPRTEDERVDAASAFGNHNGRLRALESLREFAGEALCANCRYATMTPLATAQERAALARAEADQLEAITLRAKALAELAEIDPAYKNLG